MYSRILPGRLNRRSAAARASAFGGNFGALFTGVLQYLRSDLGLSTTGAIVNAWADQSGNGVNVVEATGGVGLGTVTTGLNGHAGIAGGTGGQFGSFTLNRPPPGTTPTFFWGVARLLTNPGAGQGWLLGETTAQMLVYAAAGANMSLFNNGGVGPVTAAVGAWGRFEAAFTNTVSDYVKFGTPAAATGNAGNADPSAARNLFATSAGGNPGNWELLTLVTMDNVPSAGVLADAAAKAQAFYTSAVAI